MVFALLGLHIKAEERTNKGRIDAVIETEDGIYLFEFKMVSADAEKAADEALNQIRDNAYFEKYLKNPEGKNLIPIGVGFDVDGRGITGWKIGK